MWRLRFSLCPTKSASVDGNAEAPDRTAAAVHVVNLDEVTTSFAIRSRSDDVFFTTNLTHPPLWEEDVRLSGVVPGRSVDVSADALVGSHVS